MKESYDVWHPDPWPMYSTSVGELVDTFDSDNNKEPGWEKYNITRVVKDSLGSTRNRVNFILRYRDETKSYKRIVSYNSDGDNSQPFDSTNISPDLLSKFPYIEVVYQKKTPIQKKMQSFVGMTIFSVDIYSLNGQQLGSYQLDNKTSIQEVMKKFSKGMYVLNLKHAEGIHIQPYLIK